jgi:hypothetical protein
MWLIIYLLHIVELGSGKQYTWAWKCVDCTELSTKKWRGLPVCVEKFTRIRCSAVPFTGTSFMRQEWSVMTDIK